ncbi:uncharacterized protein FIBRA_05489 [Fibroporia radiculosa]|uniref:RRM domain-containing protein n=1 Tax=Fibroporia radiculosa TaxID=599839 RepID=J4GR43_9APHY|nr:uncharacterized protein FIBRA_05489 [Fibroporia radiculosa]CCM03360.1 predicted protein [Fibroporia radiculosa]
MARPQPSQPKPASPPPPYSEFADSASQPPLAMSAPENVSAIPSFPAHPGYGPTPIAQQTQLLPYYDPRSPHAIAEATTRARWRFLGALFWAVVILSVASFMTGYEVQLRVHGTHRGGWGVFSDHEDWRECCARFCPSAVLVAVLAVDVLSPPSSRFNLLLPPTTSKPVKSIILSSHLPSLASLVSGRPLSSAVASHPSGEEFINRSLLDSVDAQADAEPISSSDSEAPGNSVNTFGSLSSASSMSIGSPSVPYHIPMQSQQPPARPDSPSNNNIFPSHLKPSQHSTDPYSMGTPHTNTNQSVYNNMNSIHIPTSDFAPLSSEPDALNYAAKVNGFGSGPFRTSASFNPFPARTRHNTVPFRDTSSSFNTVGYPGQSADLFGGPNSQSQATYAFDSVHHPGRPHDYTTVGPQANVPNGMSQSKQHSFGVESFRPGAEPSTLQVNQQGSMSLHPSGPQPSFQGQFANGMSHGLPNHNTLPSTQFGPTLSANGPGSGPSVGGQGGTVAGASGMNHANGNTQAQQQEEISTIFVVGFPEDMQEREFQNMFTFSPGFEAATLKIPNKEFTAYGSASAPTGPNARLYPGSNDPYNLVTVNQGGVVVDGGRDGTTTSWPAAPMQNDESHFVPSNLPVQPPRKQIIGFAKFRTRQEALEARDILQGRRVDIERGAVLKAEMAKKNLHTKRGPGVPPGMPLNSLMNGVNGSMPETLVNFSGLNGLAGLGGSTNVAGEAFAQRDRELGALGAMGIAGLGQRRDRIEGRDDEERERRRAELAAVGVMNFSGLGSRGARERAEEDERERERKRKEKEAARLRQNSNAFEAFHSVPQQMVRQGANSVLSAENPVLPNAGSTAPSPPALHTTPSQNGTSAATSPWSNLRDVGISAALRKMPVPVLPPSLPQRPLSPSQRSPPIGFDSSVPFMISSQNGNGAGICSVPFSPQSNPSSLPGHPSLPSRPRAGSPGIEQPQPMVIAQSVSAGPPSLPDSNASSASGSQNGHDDEVARSVTVLAVSTDQGATSPQLPSPASGASSAAGRNPGDQNPPINTLYVGNLPTSPAPGGFPLNYLEDRLRDLFSKRPGYRKLCFRQKSNGPMCFVEFEDVNYATKALNELYGNTLNGLVKGGGIRLSYSKNPLGVRTPTSAGKDSNFPQQQGLTMGQSFNDAFATRLGDSDAGRAGRRDTGMTSPTSSYHYTTSPPPPRFISPPPLAPFSAPLISPTAFPRANPQGFSLATNVNIPFSPFGISHSTIPDQPSADASNDSLAHNLSSTTPNIEASRAG